jgi:hypothetical protein
VVPVVRVWRSPDGWSILRPTGWRGARKEAYTEWAHGKMAHLGVEAVYSNADPYQAMRDSESAIRQNNQDVRVTRRATVMHKGTKAVEWEFTYTAGTAGAEPWAAPGVRYHEVRRAVVGGDTAYLLSWTATETGWRRNQALMRQVMGSFTVAP